ncbi:hypothetical protein BC826DRAFT_1189249 [Russula brevipes]|nr:hypothetical protein BC826DRAFT_1189249 [Russula brevipes]
MEDHLGPSSHVWTIWIYSFTRVATLAAVLLIIVDFNLKAPYSCQALLTLYTISASVAVATAELLIVLRVIAIWNKKRSIKTIAIGVWVINGLFLIQVTSRLRSRRSASDYCLPRNIQIIKLSTISTFVTDTVLLLIMLVGLLRLRIQGAGMLSLGQLLWKQGIIWFLIATAAGALATIFLLLDLNDVWSINPAVQPLKRLEVAVHSTRVSYPTAQMSGHGPYADTDGPVTYKPNGSTPD